MNRPVSLWILLVTLFILALGGMAGAYGFLSDPTGLGMGMAGELGQLPVPDYTLPGYFLLVVMCIFPAFLMYGLFVRPTWKVFDPLEKWSKMRWPLVGSLALGIALAFWLSMQACFIGFSAPVQWFTAILDFSILVTTLAPATRNYFAQS